MNEATADCASAMENAKAIQSQRYGKLNFRNKNQSLVFPSYICISNIAEQYACRRVLEIGSGWSTVVWADFVQRTGAEVCSIDADFSRLRSYVRGTRHDTNVSKHVELLEGTTIRSDDLIQFYLGKPRENYAGVAVSALLKHVDEFKNRNCSFKRYFRICQLMGTLSWSAQELMSQGSSLLLRRKLVDLYSSNRNFDDEVSFLKKAESRRKAGLLDTLSKEVALWDMVFFDSGELASMIEWEQLKDKIAVGGFAAFHDIYIPKSIKNIIPCASVNADPNWNVLLRDDSTKQGLLIAQRMR